MEQSLLVAALQGFNIPSEGLWFWFEGLIDLFFYMDLALNFFTAYEVGMVPSTERCMQGALTCSKPAASIHNNLLLQPMTLPAAATYIGNSTATAGHLILTRFSTKCWSEVHNLWLMQDPISGEYITEYKLIAQRYLQGWFAVDLLATLPVDYIVRGVEVNRGPETLQVAQQRSCSAYAWLVTLQTSKSA